METVRRVSRKVFSLKGSLKRKVDKLIQKHFYSHLEKVLEITGNTDVFRTKPTSLCGKHDMRRRWDSDFHFRTKTNVMKSALLFVWVFALAGESSAASAWSGLGNRLTRDTSCRENREYSHQNLCCSNCPAGQYVKTACERAGEKGTCEACDPGTYTEHPNGLTQCLQCTKCRKDQVVTRVCASTNDTECQCKADTFCVPDQACEVCKKCTKCKDDEEPAKNCTATSNRVCKKSPPATSDPCKRIIPAIVLAMLGASISLLCVCCWRKRRSRERTDTGSDLSEVVAINKGRDGDGTMEELQNRQNAGLENPLQDTQPPPAESLLVGATPLAAEEEDRGLGDSLPNTTSSSQTSLTTQPTALPSSSSPHPSPETQRQPAARGEFCLPTLIPVNGEESLKKAFDVIEKNLPWEYRNKFFRYIGLSDNTIQDIDRCPGDQVYKLLTIWLEKEGLKADVNDLIQALLILQLKYCAETVSREVTDLGYFKSEDESS